VAIYVQFFHEIEPGNAIYASERNAFMQIQAGSASARMRRRTNNEVSAEFLAES